MMPYQSYQLYQAERPKTAAEIRRADDHLGHMAENVSRLWLQATRPVARLRGQARQRQCEHGRSQVGNRQRAGRCVLEPHRRGQDQGGEIAARTS